MNKRLTPQMSAVALAFALASAAGVASAAPGYVSGSAGDPLVTSPYGLCWKTGDWTVAQSVAPCDAVPVATVPAPVVVAAKPAPAPAPAPAPVIEQVSLDADVLFEFDSAKLRPEGQAQLQALVDRLKNAQVESILTVGYADPIGPAEYNKKLSQARADTVRDYLAKSGVERTLVRTEGRGETQEFTGAECKGLRGDKLIDCLKPNRRVDIEVRGTRVAGGGAPSAGSGTTVPSVSPATSTPSDTGTRTPGTTR